ncbi:hypothetical protein DES42_11027 [Zavarzinia compransoris]|nr:hypothetical protein DES42_11027 [Zavarzinia compransoris]
MRQVRTAIGAATINPELLTAAEQRLYEGYLRQEDTNGAILGLAKEGVAIKEIVRGQRSDVFRTRESSLEIHLPWPDAQWAAGQRNTPSCGGG